MNDRGIRMIDPKCSDAIEPILELLEGKWTLLILRGLFNGLKRFGELRRALDPISPKTLTDRLRLLEEKGIVTRKLFSEVPLHVEYELTERGQGLQPIFAAMRAWAGPVSDEETSGWIRREMAKAYANADAGRRPENEPDQALAEAPILLGREEGSHELKHFVDGHPVEAGAWIEAKFGEGWIRGRYEWSLGKDTLIQIHSADGEVVYIREGHPVRLKLGRILGAESAMLSKKEVGA